MRSIDRKGNTVLIYGTLSQLLLWFRADRGMKRFGRLPGDLSISASAYLSSPCMR